MPETLCVAGASGLVGSHIVAAALAAGYRVNGTLRDATQTDRTKHLEALPGAGDRLSLFSADMSDPESFEAPLEGASGVFIACLPEIREGRDGTPASELDEARGRDEIIRPVEEGCLGIMAAAARNGVGTVIICSSTGSTNPPDDLAVKTEIEAVSDPADQIARKKFTPASKTVMEASATRFAAENGQRLCILLPTLMLGPVILPEHLDRGINRMLRDMATGDAAGHDRAPAGSISAAHIDDVAALFLAAYRMPSASGRYFALYDSWPWQDIYRAIAPHVPAHTMPAPLDGEPEPPTRFDFTRRDSLGVDMRDIATTIDETMRWINARHAA